MESRYWLCFESGARRGERVRVPSGPAVAGRSGSCDLVLPDPSVSGTHARFESGPNGVRVTDLDSRNGVRVGGVRVDEHLLAHGDRVELGKLVLRLEDAALVGEPAAVASAEAVPELEHLDAGRVRGGARPLVWIALVLVLVAGGVTLVLRRTGAERGASSTAAAVVEVPGNLLADASFEESDGNWSVVSGAALERSATERHRGASGLTAFVPEEAALVVRSPAVRVREGRGVEAAVFVRAPELDEVRLGLRFTSSTDPARRLVVDATRASGPEDFRELSLTEGVPPGFDTVRLEVTGAGATGGTFALDDALLRETEPRAGRTLAHEEYTLHLHGADADSATLVRIGRVGAAGLAFRDGAARLALDVSPTDVGFALRPRGAPGAVELEFALGASLWELGLASLHPTAADGTGATGGLQRRSGEFTAEGVRGLLAGEGTALVRFDFGRPANVRVTRRDDELLVRARGVEELALQLSFRTDRNRAADLADAGRRAERGGEPAAALASWAELLREVPVDEALVAEAEEARARLLREGLDGVEEVRREFGRARFFDLPEIYARNLRELERLSLRFAGSEVERAARELEAEVTAALAEHADHERARRESTLARVAGILERSGADALADHVRDEARALGTDPEELD